jgi:curved DNA-binding protein CbpA
MMREPASAGSDCIALAVEFFREPSRFPDLLHGRRLPPGITALLQIAANNRASQSREDVSEQQQAARFFIEHVLMAHNANHYRVLGVTPFASPEEIKEHHRLLMRLFHPDRQTTPDARNDAIATRINRAYTVLRYPESRANYDLSLAEKREMKPPVPNYANRVQPVDSSGFLMRMPSFVVRHLSLFALGSIALLAALGVSLVYVNRTPAGAIGTGERKFASASENGGLPPSLPPAVARALAEQVTVAPPIATKNPEEAIAPIAESSREPERTTLSGAAEPAVAKSEPRALATPLKTSKKQSPASVSDEVTIPVPAPEAGMMPVAVNLPATPETRPAPLRPDQLNRLVSRLAEQYQRGDLEHLLELFDASARIDSGDRKQIRAEYGELFHNSENRTLYIWDVTWSDNGKVARGEGSFQARVLHKGDRSPRIYNGAMTIEVVQRNDKPLIVGLYQRTEN